MDSTHLPERIWHILLHAVCAFALSNALQPSPWAAEVQPTLPGEPCQIEPLKKWSEPEKWVWTQVCEGKKADFNALYCDAHDQNCPGDWTTGRKLSATFLETILLYDPFRTALPHNGVRIVGAWFDKTVNLSSANLFHPLWLDQSMFDSSLTLNRTKATHMISLENSTIFGSLKLILFDGKTVYLKGISAEKLYVVDSTIDGTLYLDKSMIGKILRVDRAKISSSFLLREANLIPAEDAKIIFSTIGGNLELSGSKLSSLDITGTNIGGEFRLIGIDLPAAQWTSQATLTLRNTHSAVLHGSIDSWSDHLLLSGFTYDRLGGFGVDGDSNLAGQDAEWWRNWLHRQQDYSPQPYQQLASVLREAGHESKADDILYAGRKRAYDNRSAGLVKFAEYFEMSFIGFGYRNWYAAIWVLIFTLLGGFMLLWSGDFRDLKEAIDIRKIPRAFWSNKKRFISKDLYYSFDMLLPLIELRKSHYDASIELRPGVEVYFITHKLLGYVLASFLIAGLSGLTK